MESLEKDTLQEKYGGARKDLAAYAALSTMVSGALVALNLTFVLEFL